MKTAPVTSATYEAEVVSSEKPVVLVLKRSVGCPNCAAMAPVYEAFAAAHPEVKVVTVEEGENKDIGGRFFQKVTFPGTVYLVGGDPFAAMQGVQTQEALERPLAELSIPLDALKVRVYDLNAASEAGELAKRMLPATAALIAWAQRPVPQACDVDIIEPIKHVTPAAMPPSGDPTEAVPDCCG